MVTLCAAQFGVGGKAILRLGHADRHRAVPRSLKGAKLVTHLLIANDILGAVDLLGNRAHLVPERHVVGIERLEV